MDTSILLACLIGPLLVVVGLGVLINQTHYASMVESFLKDAPLYYVSGATAFVIGMAIVLNHNIWALDWQVIITILGWMSLIKGAVRILYPAAGSQIAANIAGSQTALKVMAAVLLVLGAWLSYEGFVG